MKITLFIILLLVPLLLISQNGLEPHDADMFLKVTDVNENAVPFFGLKLKKTDGTQTQSSITDTKGMAQFKVITGSNYQVLMNDSALVATLNIPQNSLSFVTQNITIPKLATDLKQAYGKIDTIDQAGLNLIRPDAGNVFLKIGLMDHLNQAVKNKEIRIFNSQTLKVYKGKTNSYGFVQFHVPGQLDYVVSVDQFERFETIEVPQHSLGLVLTFVPTKVKETGINDTIRQEPDNYMRATTERVLSKIYLFRERVQ